MEQSRRAVDEKIIVFMASSKEILGNIHNDILELKEKVAIQNGRIYKLEKWQAFVLGGCAIMGVISTIIFGILELARTLHGFPRL